MRITEVMYDAPGSDEGHEWVEITDVGSTTLNLAGYKFFESGVNHGLVLESGTSTLAAGASAIISNNPQFFLESFPAYAGAVFKSSFSLSNTGETLAIKDASSSVQDSIAYASGMGAAGDGNTLHRTSSGFVAGAPDPGAYPAIAPALLTKPAPAGPAAKTTPAIPAAAAKNKTPAAPAQAAGEAVASVAAINPLWFYIVALGALALLGAGGVLYAHPRAPALAETQNPAAEFEIEGY